MIADPGLRWILTALFAAAGVFCLERCVRQVGITGRVSDVLHTLMCAGMITMAWPATMSFARMPQVVLFAAAAVWFAVTAKHGRMYHALMMAGMAWMAFVMPWAGMTMSTTAGGHAGHAGMTMTGHSPSHVVVVAVGLTVVFLAAGIAWLARAIDHARVETRPGRRTTGLLMEGVMSLGMAVMTVAMI
ncbi:DUF5134 domain-containing protein [Amycolatopsis jejuensis]|uniref:DUF5134 domain-containing protein n=1 Tax=Amycolatopsis jejuensis TaxID=330084 RepID=UPI000525201D|nr:DUF5134 domain-containing protein [Amycolatopsis jejuensis]